MTVVHSAEPPPPHFAEQVEQVLQGVRTERQAYLLRVRAWLDELDGRAASQGLDISVFLEAVASRLNGVSEEGERVRLRCLRAVHDNHDYDIMLSLRDEREIRLRLDSAQYEIEQMRETLLRC